MKFNKPNAAAIFTITSDAQWPSVAFETDATGPHSWTWSIQWNAFKQSGTAKTPANVWDAKSVITNFGGTLTVSVIATNPVGANPVSANPAPGGAAPGKPVAGKPVAAKPAAPISVTVKIKGTNPSQAEVTSYLASKPGSSGFDKLVIHESRCKNFNGQGEPVKSFDNGYGMCQLTSPVPSFEQIWNWKLNLDGGLALFATKRASAIQYLSQSNRTYTPDQLTHEAICRWNGGSYHVWDGKAWARNSNMLCDAATGNIGWDMTDTENKGKTADQLHKRDAASYSSPPAAGSHWKYSGVCYADAILG